MVWLVWHCFLAKTRFVGCLKKEYSEFWFRCFCLIWKALRIIILIQYPNVHMLRDSSQVRGSAEDPDVGVSWIPEDWDGAGGDGSESKHLSVANPRIPHPQFHEELDIARIGGLFLGLLQYTCIIEDAHLQLFRCKEQGIDEAADRSLLCLRYHSSFLFHSRHLLHVLVCLDPKTQVVVVHTSLETFLLWCSLFQHHHFPLLSTSLLATQIGHF